MGAKAGTAKDQSQLPDDREGEDPPPMEPVVRVEVVADYLGVKPETVFRWARSKHDPLPMRQYGLRGYRRFKMSEIQSWLDRKRQT